MPVQSKGSRSLRKGRKSIPRQPYLITTTIYKREKLLKGTQLTGIVISALEWLHKKDRIDLFAYVVMPEHLHFIAALKKDALPGVMHSLKSYTSKKINTILNKQGKVWQDQYHDHAIRKEENLKEIVYYCLDNPVRKKLVGDYRDYPYWYCKWEV